MKLSLLAPVATLALMGAASANATTFFATFTTPQSSITFQSVSFSSTLAQAFDGSTLVDSVTDEQAFPANGQVDTLTGPAITSVEFSYNGGYNGPAITNLSFGGLTIDFSGHGTGGNVGSTYASEGVVFSGAVFAQCSTGCPGPNPNGFFVYGGAAGVPEPATWALMLVGFGGMGAMVRSRRKSVSAV
jgi:hypothetical protein